MSSWAHPPSRPRPVDGGLRARSTRGPIAQTWWSQRFIEVLEGIGLGSRLERGRHYARRGQVVSLDVDAGQVTAVVQGSRPRPYRTRIGIPTLGKTQWAQVERALADNAWYTAALLAGDMPEDIEDVFAAVGLALFPATAGDLSLDCTCPDQAVPCKHLAATFYLLAEQFDADPFTILAWRGRHRDDLLANLHAARHHGRPAADQAERRSRPLTDCLDDFFAQPADPRTPVPPATPTTALLDQLPDLGITVRGHDLADILRPAYRTLAPAGAPNDSARRPHRPLADPREEPTGSDPAGTTPGRRPVREG
ncbi:MAG: hypothetical protein V7637_3172 [Mycobacteriales bacterium]